MIPMSNFYDKKLVPEGSTVAFSKFDGSKLVARNVPMNTFKEHMTVAMTEPRLESYRDLTIDRDVATVTQEIGLDMDNYLMGEIIKRVTATMSARPIIEHKCNGCGAITKMDMDKHIFWCEYCGRTYAIGTAMINDRG